MKVLIVDDEVLVRKGIAMGIEWGDLGFNDVFEAKNGEVALAKAKAYQPELVITDIKMPKMDGHELIEALKVHSPHSVIIVLSCLNDMDSVRKAMGFGGAVDYIPKLSLSTEDLKDIILRCKEQMVITPYKEKITELPNNPENYIEKDFEESFRRAFRELDLEKSCDILKDLFRKLDKKQVTIDEFMEWRDILAIMNRALKERRGSLKEICIRGKNVYDYCNEACHIHDLKKRLLAVIEAVFHHIRRNRLQAYSDEMEKAIHYIQKHYKSPIKLTEISEYIGMSDTYLSKLFKKEMGINFSDYINEVRINKAKALMRQDASMPIYIIAEEVGYNSESYFSRTFKKLTGRSPNAYKQLRS